MLPSPQGVCGPLCGYNISRLRAAALWNRSPEAIAASVMTRGRLMWWCVPQGEDRA